MKVDFSAASAYQQKTPATKKGAMESPVTRQLQTIFSKMQEQSRKTAGAGRSPDVEQRRRQYKQELRACRTKKEVQAVRRRWQMEFMSELSAINKANMSAEAKQGALEAAAARYAEKNDVYREFASSGDYHGLPEDEEKEEGHKKPHDLTQAILEKQQAAKQEAETEKASRNQPETAATAPIDRAQDGGQTQDRSRTQGGQDSTTAETGHAPHAAKPEGGQQGGRATATTGSNDSPAPAKQDIGRFEGGAPGTPIRSGTLISIRA